MRKTGRGTVAKGGVKKSKLAHNDRRRLETHGFGGGMLEKDVLEVIGGWDLQLGVRGWPRNRDAIDLGTLN